MKDSESLKNEGNNCFRAKKFDEAIKLYTEAIELKKDEPILYSNRAQCLLNTNKFYEAEADCSQAIKLNQSFDKAYFRRGMARMKLMRLQPALEDFEMVLKLDPNLDLAKSEIQSIKAMLESTNRFPVAILHKPEEFRSKTSMKTHYCNVFEMFN